MDERFSRLGMLIGESGLKKLSSAHVCVFGLGGVGGHAVDALVRSGVGYLTIIDHDVVSLSNINRQLIAKTSTIGRKKIDVMEEHLLDINPHLIIKKLDLFYLPETSSSIDFESFDYVIDAIDTVSAKIDIIARCYQHNVKVISAMGCGNRLDPSFLKVEDIGKTHDDPLAKAVRQKLRKTGINHCKVVYSPSPIVSHEEHFDSKTNKPIPGSSAFLPSSAGILLAYEVIKDLLAQ